ncbi:hypothetical protein WI23_27370 [Burkholderia oklahomensis C6786]|nr:hypothetical protein WI23_27370 [Burkholderia oklahomensis C6786]KUY62243.1 hypothetical protein WI23_09235 [Burkholderia oklahomensis C6786]
MTAGAPARGAAAWRHGMARHGVAQLAPQDLADIALRQIRRADSTVPFARLGRRRRFAALGRHAADHGLDDRAGRWRDRVDERERGALRRQELHRVIAMRTRAA